MTEAELEEKRRQLEIELHQLDRQIQFQRVADDLEGNFRSEIRISESASGMHVVVVWDGRMFVQASFEALFDDGHDEAAKLKEALIGLFKKLAE